MRRAAMLLCLLACAGCAKPTPEPEPLTPSLSYLRSMWDDDSHWDSTYTDSTIVRVVGSGGHSWKITRERVWTLRLSPDWTLGVRRDSSYFWRETVAPTPGEGGRP